MFIFSFKIPKKKYIFFSILALVGLILGIVSLKYTNLYKEVYNICVNDKNIIVDDKNYLTLIKDIHDNIQSYQNKTIEVSGFIFKKPDFKSDNFVIARRFVTCCESDSDVIGYLSKYKDINKFPVNSWVKITGKIGKEYYSKSIFPVIEVISITSIPKPKNEFIYNK